MKRLVLGFLSVLIVIGSGGCSDSKNNVDRHKQVVHAVEGDQVTVKNLTIMCKNKSDAVPAALAVGIANTAVVNDFLDNGCLLFQPKKMNMKLEIMQSEKAPLPKGNYVSLYKTKVIEYNGKTVENDSSRWWIADFLNNFK